MEHGFNGSDRIAIRIFSQSHVLQVQLLVRSAAGAGGRGENKGFIIFNPFPMPTPRRNTWGRGTRSPIPFCTRDGVGWQRFGGFVTDPPLVAGKPESVTRSTCAWVRGNVQVFPATLACTLYVRQRSDLSLLYVLTCHEGSVANFPSVHFRRPGALGRRPRIRLRQLLKFHARRTGL